MLKIHTLPDLMKAVGEALSDDDVNMLYEIKEHVENWMLCDEETESVNLLMNGALVALGEPSEY